MQRHGNVLKGHILGADDGDYKMVYGIHVDIWLVLWNMGNFRKSQHLGISRKSQHGDFSDFPETLGNFRKSQLTNSRNIIFQRGRLKPPTRYVVLNFRVVNYTYTCI